MLTLAGDYVGKTTKQVTLFQGIEMDRCHWSNLNHEQHKRRYTIEKCYIYVKRLTAKFTYVRQAWTSWGP